MKLYHRVAYPARLVLSLAEAFCPGAESISSIYFSRGIASAEISPHAIMAKEAIQSNLDVDYVILYRVDPQGQLFSLRDILIHAS
jgi:hypothetical protein